jgi:trafficking kinesin-binding protein 2
MALDGSLNKTVVNEVYRVIVTKTNPNIQENGKSQEAKIGLQKPDSVVYLNSDSNLLGELRVALVPQFAHLHPQWAS